MFLKLSRFQRYDFSFKISYTSDQYPSSNVYSDLKWHKYLKNIAHIPRNYCNRQTNRCLFLIVTVKKFISKTHSLFFLLFLSSFKLQTNIFFHLRNEVRTSWSIFRTEKNMWLCPCNTISWLTSCYICSSIYQHISTQYLILFYFLLCLVHAPIDV